MLGERRSPEAGVEGAWVVLPVGALEAHGPHLPLDTDVRIATEMALRGAQALDDDGIPAVVLPALPYGAAPFAAAFPGTFSIGAPLVTALVVAIGEAARAGGARGLVFANAHFDPAEVSALFEAARRLEGVLPVAFPNVASRRGAGRFADICPLDGHAGRYETSLVLALRPDLVAPAFRQLPVVEADLGAAITRGARDFVEAGGPDAYFGDPAAASAETGERLYVVLGELVREAALAGG